MDNDEKPVKLEYFIEAVYFNKGLAKLIGGGFFGTLFSIDREWRYLYALLIGIGISGLIFWIFSFKIFKENNFNLFYFLWIFCCVVEVIFALFAIYILHDHIIGADEIMDRYAREISGFIIGVLISSILLEINLKLGNHILIEYRKL